MKLISKINIITIILLTPFLYSCEKETDNNSKIETCEICNSYCCDQVGTPDCCCNF